MNLLPPAAPYRIQVVGTSCSGKTTFAKKLAGKLQISHIELDALHWGPGWSEAETGVFQSRIVEAMKLESWIVDGSYGRKVGDTISSRRNCLIWIDIPLTVILYRFFYRSFRRSWDKEILWGGCQETLGNSIFNKNSLLIWILNNHGPSRKKYLSLIRSPPPGTVVIRLKSTSEIRRFLASVSTVR